MLTGGPLTLTQFLIETRREHPEATGALNGLITSLSVACKTIARRVAFGKLAGVVGFTDAFDIHDDAQKAGKYLLLFEPLDGASNTDINVAMGSIFSIVHAVTPAADGELKEVLPAGTRQVCAGYAMYGPSTMLVLTLGRGTHAFTLDPLLGEWVLSHPDLRIPESTREFAINASNSRFWEPAVKRYVDECLAGETGPRASDFSMRWIASLVAETHRVLMRGGVVLYPRETKEPGGAGRIRLLHEANPIAFLIEEAGGMASTGRRRLLELCPESVQQHVGFIFGSKDEVARIERYHHDGSPETYRSPLFGNRGLFASPA